MLAALIGMVPFVLSAIMEEFGLHQLIPAVVLLKPITMDQHVSYALTCNYGTH